MKHEIDNVNTAENNTVIEAMKRRLAMYENAMVLLEEHCEMLKKRALKKGIDLMDPRD
jgi:hypothetical protein